mgnify:CR=1 FL=1
MATFKFDERKFRPVSFTPATHRRFADGCVYSDAGRTCFQLVSPGVVRITTKDDGKVPGERFETDGFEVSLYPLLEVRRQGRLVLREWPAGEEWQDRPWFDPLFEPSRDWVPRRTIVTGALTCSDGKACRSLALSLGAGEPLFGLGEHFGHVNKRGYDFVTWAADMPSTPNFATYVPVPFVWSPRGWGLLVNTYSPVYFDLGKASYDRLLVITRGDLDAYLILGATPKDILRKLYDLTGAPREPPPKWSFGYWQSKCAYYSQDEVLSVARELRQRGYPADVIHIDPPWEGNWKKYRCDVIDLEWDTEAFPRPRELVDELHKMHFKLSLWINPYIEPGTRLWSRLERFLAKSADGGPARPAADCQMREGAGIVDLTDPRGFEAFKEALKELVLPYADVIKADYGEAVPEDAVFSNGMRGEEAHNYYPVLYMKAVYEATKEAKGYGIVWGRSGSTGVWNYPLNWGGDTPSSWEGLRQALRGLLSYHASGALFGSFDVGGFLGKPTDELYVRWLQAGVTVSHVRAHGVTDREPWKYAPEASLAALRLRYRLLPYIYSEAWRAVRERVPMVRPLFLEHPDDPTTYDIDDEYYLGEELLVAPITEEGGRRLVYLPRGTWIEYFTGRELSGPAWVEVSYDLDKFPIFVKANSIVPMLDHDAAYVEDGPFDGLEFHAYRVSDATYTYYDDGVEAKVTCRAGSCSVSGLPASVRYRFVYH